MFDSKYTKFLAGDNCFSDDVLRGTVGLFSESFPNQNAFFINKGLLFSLQCRNPESYYSAITEPNDGKPAACFMYDSASSPEALSPRCSVRQSYILYLDVWLKIQPVVTGKNQFGKKRKQQ